MTGTAFARMLDALTGPASGYAQTLEPIAGILDLSIGEARYPLPHAVQHVMRDAVGGFDRIWYSSPAGEAALRAAFASHLHGVGNTEALARQVLVTAGGKEAAWLAVQYVIDRFGIRRALIPQPGWQPYTLWLDGAGCRPVSYDPATLAHDPAMLRAMVQENMVAGRAPLLVVNYPHNPTGLAIDQQRMNHLVGVAADLGAPVVSDEVYRTFAPGHVTAVRAPAFDPGRHLVADSTSKWLTTAGLRIGFLHADATIVEELAAYRSSYASCTSVVAQRVAEAFITDATVGAWLAETRRTIENDRTATVHALVALGVPVTSHGGLYVWAARPALATLPTSQADAARISDGAGFGAPGMFRICTARADLEPMLAAAAVVTALRGG